MNSAGEERGGCEVMGILNEIRKRQRLGREKLTSWCIKPVSCCRWTTALQRSRAGSELLPLGEALTGFVLPHPKVSTDPRLMTCCQGVLTPFTLKPLKATGKPAFRHHSWRWERLGNSDLGAKGWGEVSSWDTCLEVLCIASTTWESTPFSYIDGRSDIYMLKMLF